MTEFPLISIIIPCFNDGQFVELAINSALQQSYPNKEIILIDDGSDDKTRKFLKNFENRIDKIIFQPNKGTSAARNAGITQAQGDYILTLDSDDHFEKEFCLKAMAILQKNVDVKIVTCYAQRFRGNQNLDVFKPKSGELVDFLKYNHALGTSLFLRKDWKEIGGYDETMKSGYEDWEFYIRLLKAGGKSIVIPEVLFHYRLNKTSNSSRANEVKYDLLKYIYIKHKDLYIQHYDTFVSHIIDRLYIVEKAEQKNLNKPEFKLGAFILRPMRIIRKFIRFRKGDANDV